MNAANPSGPGKPIVPLAPLRVHGPALWTRHLHWLLMLALIPLAFSLLGKQDDVEERFVATFRELAMQQAAAGGGAPQPDAPATSSESPAVPPGEYSGSDEAALDGEDVTVDDLLQLVPDHKIKGAWLSRDTHLHWLFALLAAAGFLTFFALLASDNSSKARHLILIGIFTATVGIFLLLAFQFIAGATQGVWVRGRGVLTLLFYIVKFIGYSYTAAANPDNGFLLSFLGYTCGVGLCEELCKALPLMWHYRHPTKQSWRGAFQWGLASGAGFGLSEAVMYAGNYYNGIHGPGIYLVRFISCVALHALWSGSVGISIHQRRSHLQSSDDPGDYCVNLLMVTGIPMVLHGLYDTLLKKEMNVIALLVAFASFGYLAVLIARVRSEDDSQADAEMMRDYRSLRENFDRSGLPLKS